jgi:N-acetylglucosamine-6-phosphate deacetylase
METLVKNLREDTGCSVVEALEAASYHPAQLLGIEKKKGTLDYGADADFVVLDKETLTVEATYIAGELAWKRS